MLAWLRRGRTDSGTFGQRQVGTPGEHRKLQEQELPKERIQLDLAAFEGISGRRGGFQYFAFFVLFVAPMASLGLRPRVRFGSGPRTRFRSATGGAPRVALAPGCDWFYHFA